MEGEDAVGPIDVFGFEGGDVGLAATGFPEDFVEESAFRADFGGDDLLMLLPSNAAAELVFDLGPAFGSEDGPGEPAEAQGEVVEAAQVVVGGGAACVEDEEEVLAGGLDEGLVPDEVEGLADDGP